VRGFLSFAVVFHTAPTGRFFIMTYKEQLRDKRWLSKRQTILNRDERQCQHCPSRKSLQVHHKYYLNGFMAWEYPDIALITLCKSCHENEEKALEDISKSLLVEFRRLNFDSHSITLMIKSLKRLSNNGIDGANQFIDLAHNFSALPTNDRLALMHICEKLYYCPSTINYIENGN